jgi:hypothetical protein
MAAYRRLSEARENALADVLDMDEEVLRGVSLPSLMAGGARLFADDGAAARVDPTGTFALSKPVESLTYFISHSWRTSRLLKYCAFCVRFNLERAAIASACANFIAYTVSLFYQDALPEWLVADFFHVSDYAPSKGTMLCEATGILVFIPVLLLGHLAFDRQDSFFLDVACISQDDEKLKASGIASLGAILDRSERMLVLCDGNYFSRLWCLFEISAFAKRAGSSRLDLVPLHAPLRTCGWVLCFLLFYVAMSTMLWPGIGPKLVVLLYTNSLNAPLYTTCWMLFGMPFVITAELEAIRIRSALLALRTFRLTDAQCYSEGDREAILSVIGKWWTDHSSGEADADRLRQLGHHRFERFVRYELAPQLTGRLAGNEWTLRTLFCLYIGLAHGWILDLLAYSDSTVYHIVGYVCYGAFCFGVWLPTFFEGVKLVASLHHRLRGRIPQPALVAFTLVGLVVTSLTVSLIMYLVPFPNVLLDPDFRWPDGGLVGDVGEFGTKVLRFQVVLGAYSLIGGIWWAS